MSPSVSDSASLFPVVAEKGLCTLTQGIAGDLLDLVRAAIIVRDRAQGTILFWNSGAEELYGWPKEVAIGTTTHALLRTQFPQPLETILGVLAREGSWSGELRHTTRTGQQIVVQSHWIAMAHHWVGLKQADVPDLGETILEVNTDITAHKAAEQERERAEARYRALLEAAPDAIVTCNAGGQIVLVNSQTEVLFGYPRAELLGKQVEILLPQGLDTRHATHRSRYLADPHPRMMGSGLDLFARRKDGSVFPCEISLSPVTTEGDYLITTMIRDISARKATEAALRESERRLHTVIATAPVILFTLDAAGMVTLCEGHPRLIQALSAPQDLPDGYDLPEPAPGTPIGQPVTVLFRHSVEILEEVRKTLAGADGAVIYQAGTVALNIRLVPLRDDHGTVRGVIGVATDMTEHVRAELAENAVHARDEFLSIAAHELKTPLTGLRGFAQILLTYLRSATPVSPERIQRALGQIERQTGKVNRLVDQLLDVTRLEGGRLVLDRQISNLSQIVLDVVNAAQSQTTEHSFQVNAPQAIWATVDALRLEQVVTNLVSNAVKFSPEGGAIEVTVILDTGNAARLTVRDHGIGIPVEHRDRVFDRFYQAHDDNLRNGLGLGLYISREIVALHGGELKVDFPADGGSLFTAHLPLDRGSVRQK